MTWQEIVSAVCIYLSAIVYSLSLQLESKKKILFVQSISTLLYSFNYFFVLSVIPSAIGGVITSSFELLRLIMFYFITKSEKFNTRKINLTTSIVFVTILTICSIVFWNSWYSILPLIGTIVTTLVFSSKNVILLKSAFLLQAICITTYLFLLSLWINAISQIIILLFGSYGLITHILQLKKQEQDFQIQESISKNTF